MILLFGGTGETQHLADAIAKAGYDVLVSTATDVPLAVGEHKRIRRRCGRLNKEQINALVEKKGILAVVDGTHPYAGEVQKTVRSVAAEKALPYLRYQREQALENESGLILVDNHEEAARTACSFGQPVLLTTGSRNLAPYVDQARALDVPILARVLPHEESTRACDAAGLLEQERVQGRGPFTLEQNRDLIRTHRIGVLVTKDSGTSGGVLEKLEAARMEGCRLVVVRRPANEGDHVFVSMDTLIGALKNICPLTQDN